MISSLRPIADGLSYGVTLVHEKVVESTITQGAHYYQALSSQFYQIGYTFLLIGKVAHSLTSRTALVKGALGFLALKTMSLTVVAAMFKHNRYQTFAQRFSLSPTPPAWMQKVLHFTADHIGDMSQLVASVASIALCIVGREKEGLSVLIVLGVGYLDRHEILPLAASRFINAHLPTLTSIIGLLIGSPFVKVLSVIDLINKIAHPLFLRLKCSLDELYSNYLRSQGVPYPSLREVEMTLSLPQRTTPKLTKQQILSNRMPHRDLLVDPAHAKRQPHLDMDVHDVQYETLESLFHTINWKEEASFAVLEKKILDDDRWREYYNTLDEAKKAIVDNRDSPSGREDWKNLAIEWTEGQLNLFLSLISYPAAYKENKPLKPIGDISEEIKKDARIVIKYLSSLQQTIQESKLPEEEVSALKQKLLDCVLRFAIDGGNYCASGISDAVRDNLIACIATSQNPLTDGLEWHHILDLYLLNRRTQIFQWIMQNSILLRVFEPGINLQEGNDNERHGRNLLQKMYGQGLGLDMQSIKSDAASFFFAFQELCSLFQTQIRFAFWQNAYPPNNKTIGFSRWFQSSEFRDFKPELKEAYNETVLLEVFNTLWNNKVITPGHIASWWNQYLEKFNEEDSAELSELLTNGSLFTVNFDNSVTCTPLCLKIMFIEMDYLRSPF